MEIGQIYNEKRFTRVKKLQNYLTSTWEARAHAVKAVCANKGAKTPGIDMIIWDSPSVK
jgi:RNA-directed DNA polymerase